MRRIHFILLLTMAGWCSNAPCAEPPADASADAAFNKLADEYITGFLAWRPLEAMQLGFHEYDGKLTDFSRASVDGEVARLKEFDHRLDRIKSGGAACG